DEPFSGFDPVNANLIKDEILQLQREGATVIFSTHRMESVEELCDHIALIDHSNKVLDGKVSDIKRTYKSNTFQVGLVTENEKQLEQELKEKFEVSAANFKTLADELKLNIKIDASASPNELLNYLTTKAEVNH